MNERFKQLKRKAVAEADTSHIDYEFMSHDEIQVLEGIAVEKAFAELIVRECSELSVNSQYDNTKSEYYEGFNEALIYVGNKIKKHFGV